jgi:hypothetical protein
MRVCCFVTVRHVALSRFRNLLLAVDIGLTGSALLSNLMLWHWQQHLSLTFSWQCYSVCIPPPLLLVTDETEFLRPQEDFSSLTKQNFWGHKQISRHWRNRISEAAIKLLVTDETEFLRPQENFSSLKKQNFWGHKKTSRHWRNIISEATRRLSCHNSNLILFST